MTGSGPPAARRPVSAATLLGRPGIAALSRIRRYPTGLGPLDAVLGGGVAPRELLVLGAAGPGGGKTTAALGWARSMALSGAVVVYASYQHDERDLLNRLLALELVAVAEPGEGRARAEAWRLLEGFGRGGQKLLGPATSPLVQRTAARLNSYGDRLVLLRGTSATDTGVLRRVIDEQAGDDVVLFVDPVEKVPGPAGATAAALRDIAVALDVAVVAVQGGRAAAAGTPAAAEADLVVLLHEARRAGQPLVSVEKNRRVNPLRLPEQPPQACRRLASLVARTRSLRA